MTDSKYVIVLLILFFSTAAFSQEGEYVTVRDLESWNSLELNYKINKHWKVGLQQQMRLYDDASKIDAHITDLTTKLDLGKYVYGGLGLRYSRQMDDVGAVQGFENHFRFNLDLGAEHDVNRFTIEYRLRYQSKNEMGISKEEGDYANRHMRLKVGVQYNIKKWKLDPEFSSEIFRHYQQDEVNGFDKFRVTIGTKYKMKSYGKVGVFYRMERELNAVYPQTTNIIGLKYSYTFKK